MTTRPAHGPYVNRRLGGLEVVVQTGKSLCVVNRRVGGLEAGRKFIVFSHDVNRRVGGLEDQAWMVRQIITVNRGVGGLEVDMGHFQAHQKVNRRLGGLEDHRQRPFLPRGKYGRWQGGRVTLHRLGRRNYQ